MSSSRHLSSARSAAALAILLCGSARGADWFVATNGSDGLSGTSTGTPFRTIQRALDAATEGDFIRIRGGTYREFLSHGSRAETGETRLTLAPFGDEEVSVKGSDIVAGWALHAGSTWKRTNWTINSQQVFVDGAPLRQVGWPNDYTRSKADMYSVFGTGLDHLTNGTFHYDRSNLTLYAWLADGSAPSGHVVEASTRIQVVSARNNLRFDRLRLGHCNSTAQLTMGWPGVSLGRNCVIENCVIDRCDFAGLGFYSYSRVSNCVVSGNGSVGLGWSYASNCLVTHCSIVSNNYRGYYETWHAGGIKSIPETGGIVENCDVAWNYGSGIWFDTSLGGELIVIRNNVIHDNVYFPDLYSNRFLYAPVGIHIELVKRADIYNNVIASNSAVGLYISGSDHVRVHHNTFVANRGPYELQMSGVPRAIDATRWASLVGNEIFNNVFYDSRCDFLLAVYDKDDLSPTRLIVSNRCDFNGYYSPTRVPWFSGSELNTNDLAAWAAYSGWDTNSFWADPLLDGSAAPPWPPAAGSPVIDAASPLSFVTNDCLARTRPLDGDTNGTARPDIGAHEFVHPAADTDADGDADTNELVVGTNPTAPDTDGDRMTDGAERVAGTNPLDPQSLFRLTPPAPGEGEQLVLRWSSATNRIYSVAASSNLAAPDPAGGFAAVTSGLAATPPENAYTTNVAGVESRYYRVSVEP